MTYPNETLAIITHLKEILLAFTDLDDVTPALKEELEDEALIKAGLIWESMGGRVDGIGAGANQIHVEFELKDIEAFLTQKASEQYVEDEA
jgi:hypothetical protein